MILQGFMYLMLTHAVKKIVDTIASTMKPVMVEEEGVDANLIVIHKEYLENALVINWIKARVMNHMDT